MTAREVARWTCIVGANRLVNPDPHTWKNTGKGGYIYSEPFATDPKKTAARLERLASMSATEHQECPLFVELCAGTAALSLALQGGANARPPVSRMGSKRGYVRALLWILGLRTGQGAGSFLWCEPDSGARLMLQAYPQPDVLREAAKIIRSWSDEEPRALWERLKAEGPIGGAEGVARWTCSAALSRPGGSGSFRGKHKHRENMRGWYPEPVNIEERTFTIASLPWPPVTVCADAREVDPREVAKWACLAQGSYRRGQPSSGFDDEGDRGRSSASSVVLGNLRTLPATWPPVTITADAREVDPPQLPEGTVCYMDPPYQGTTGYGNDLPREEVLELARRWHDAGAIVMISEAVGLAADLPGEWWEVDITSTRVGQARTFSRQKVEMVTLNRAPQWVPHVQQGLFA